MKSLFLLCEYGISYHTIKVLEKNNISYLDILLDPECLFRLWNRGSQKAKGIINAINCVENDLKNESIFDLVDLGISLNSVKHLFEKEITIEKLKFLDASEVQTLTGLNNPISKKIAKILRAKNYNSEEKELSGHNYILSLIEKSEISDFCIEDIRGIFNSRDILYCEEEIMKDLSDLVNKNKLVKNGNKYSWCCIR